MSLQPPRELIGGGEGYLRRGPKPSDGIVRPRGLLSQGQDELNQTKPVEGRPVGTVERPAFGFGGVGQVLELTQGPTGQRMTGLVRGRPRVCGGRGGRGGRRGWEEVHGPGGWGAVCSGNGLSERARRISCIRAGGTR